MLIMTKLRSFLLSLCAATIAPAFALAAADQLPISQPNTALLQPADPDAIETPPADKSGKDAKSVDRGPITGRANRVAIINFGPPSSWNGKFGDTVGIQVNNKAFKDAIPLLEKDKVDTVVIRVNSGGGLVYEMLQLQETFEKYKEKFRTVVWIESAISAAVMGPWVIEEFYMMPEGNMGAATMWSGNMEAGKGAGLEQIFIAMEKASLSGKKDNKVMRAMQVMAPLSANVDENGRVTFFQDTSGQYLINPENRVLTLNAADAVKYGIAKGIAGTREELAKAMGLNEVEWAGEDATKLIDRSIRDNDRIQNQLNDTMGRYNNSVSAAAGMNGNRRRQEVGIARQRLAEIRRLVKTNPTIGLMGGIGDEWFAKQEDILRDLNKGP
jgi:hypothetical protein